MDVPTSMVIGNFWRKDSRAMCANVGNNAFASIHQKLNAIVGIDGDFFALKKLQFLNNPKTNF